MKKLAAILIQNKYHLPLAIPVENFSSKEVKKALSETFDVAEENIVELSSSPSMAYVGIKKLTAKLHDTPYSSSFETDIPVRHTYPHVLELKYIRLA